MTPLPNLSLSFPPLNSSSAAGVSFGDLNLGSGAFVIAKDKATVGDLGAPSQGAPSIASSGDSMPLLYMGAAFLLLALIFRKGRA